MEVPGRVDRTTPKSSDNGELFCSPCKLDNKYKKGDGYCEVCREYLCATCEDCHRKFRMTRTHRILKAPDIPNTSSLSPDTTCTEPCDKHPEEFIKYICHDHNVLVCGACTTMDHRTCKIGYIPDIAKTFKDTEEYKSLLSYLDETGLKLDKIQQMVRNGRSDSKTLRNDIKTEIKTLRSHINTFLDKQEQELLANASHVWQRNETVLDEMQKCEAKTRQQWQNLKCELEEQGESLSKHFITSKLIEPDVTRLHTEVDNIFTHSQIQKYKLKPSEALKSLMAHDKGIGEILPATTYTSKSNISFARKINIKHGADKSAPRITGMTVLSSNRILLADHANNSLKLFDTTNQTVTSCLELPDSPFDVTCLPSNQSAVTIPNKQLLAIISIDDSLSEIRQISLSSNCYGICYYNGKLVSCGLDANKTKMVQVLALDGTIYKVVSIGYKDTWVVGELYIAQVMIWSNRYMFTRDEKRDIVMINSDGWVVSRLQDSRLSSPVGLVAVGDNYIAVCNLHENKIHIITEKNKEIKMVDQWDCVKLPEAIAFSNCDGTIYVSSAYRRERQYVYVYELSK